jgi:hypothetical protein
MPGVGAHLLDHPETIATWSTLQPVPDEGDQFWGVAFFAETDWGLNMAHVGTKPPLHGLSIIPNAARPESAGPTTTGSSGPTCECAA